MKITISFLAAAVSVAVSVYLYRRGLDKKKIDVLVGESIPVVRTDLLDGDKIDIKYANEKVDKVYKTNIKFTSSGNVPIRKDDINDQNIEIKVGGSMCRIMDCYPIYNEGLVTVDMNRDEETVANLEIEPLNPGDSFELEMLSNKRPLDKMEVDGKIIGGRMRGIKIGRKSKYNIRRGMKILMSLFTSVALASSIGFFWIFENWFRSLFSYYGSGLYTVNLTTGIIFGLMVGVIVVCVYWIKEVRKIKLNTKL